MNIGKLLLVVLAVCLVFISPVARAQQALEEIEIRISRQTNTLYQIFNQVSRQTGFFFIYDSDIVDSDKEIRIGNRKTHLKEFLSELIPDPDIEFKIIKNHILIHKPAEILAPGEEAEKEEAAPGPLMLQGRVQDRETGQPLPYAAVGLMGKARGVPSNADGIFMFQIPQIFVGDTIVFSHLGYKAQQLPISLLRQGFTEVNLEMEYISLQEIIISYFNPHTILYGALANRKANYPSQPSCHISFYREGIQMEEKIMVYSEAILREYKPSYFSTQPDQVGLLQSRTISNINREDTLIFKLKAGIKSSGEMDLVRFIPDFLDREFMGDYNYEAAGVIPVGDGYAYVIDFEPKKHIREPLHQGTLYIDKETLAIINIDFEINTRYIRNIQSRFIPRPNPNFVTHIQGASYSVSYRQHNDQYHLSHVRAELKLRARLRNRLFGRSYRVFFEKAIVQIETQDVQRLPRREAMRTNVVLADQNFIYDYDFWGDYNIIPPEREINKALSRINSKIESLMQE